MRDASRGPLSRSRAAQARLPRPIRERPPCVSAHESHRAALQVQRAAVRGAPDLRSAVHPPTALVCWQVCGPLTAPMASILRHHPGGARQAAPGGPVDDPGAAAATRLRLSSTAQPDIRLHSVGGRRQSGAAWERAFDGPQAAVPGSSVAARRSSRRTPCACLGLRRCSGRAALEVRTAGCRRAGLLPLPGRSARTYCRAGGAFQTLEVLSAGSV